MNDKLPEPQNGQQGPNAQDPSRRRLLRAAASAAPLIATLPSGAALANSSAFQCIQYDKGVSDQLNAGPVKDYVTPPPSNPPPPGLDTFIRSSVNTTGAVSRVVWTRSSPSKSIPTFLFANNGKYYREDTGVEWNYDGEPSEQQINWTNDFPGQSVAVLNVYKPAYTGGVLTHVDPCGVGANDLPNSGCVFPVARRDSSINGNMGISGTCLTSIAVHQP